MTKVSKQRVTIFMQSSIAKQARAQAVVEELSLTSLVERALLKYLPIETIVKKVDPEHVSSKQP